jgi:hypothetical protein
LFRFLRSDSEVTYFKTGSNAIGKSQTGVAFEVCATEDAFSTLLTMIEVLPL